MAKMGKTVSGLKKRKRTPIARPSKAAGKKPVKTRISGTPRPLLLPAIEGALCEVRGGQKHEWIRASQVYRYCARAEAIERLYGDPDNAFSVGMGLTDEAGKLPIHLGAVFAQGTAMHHHYQNHVLGPAGVWWGRWECHTCSAKWGGAKPNSWVQHPRYDKDLHGGAWPPPSEIPFARLHSTCNHHHIELLEAATVDNSSPISLMVGGHIDGGVKSPSGNMFGGEIKTISEKQFAALTKPLPVQVIQASVYCYLFGLPAMVFLYVSKGWHPVWDFPKKSVGAGYGYGPFKEFVVKPDPAIVRSLRLGRELINNALADQDAGLPPQLPERTQCKKDGCGRARECPVAEICWSE